MDLIEYHSTFLFKSEAETLWELETILGTNIPKLDYLRSTVFSKETKFRESYFGFVEKDNHIVELSLCASEILFEGIEKKYYNAEKLILPQSLQNLKYLEHMILKRNSLSKLPEWIGSLSSLKKFYIYQNGIQTLPESFSELKNLVELEIFELSFLRLPKNFGDLISLKKLMIYDTEFSDELIIPESFGNLNNLNYLDLYNTSIRRLPRSFNCLDKLEYLDLRHCRFNKFPRYIKNLKSLKILKISCNPSPLIASLQNLELLEIFIYLEEMPEYLLQLPRLRVLDLYKISKDQNNIKILNMLEEKKCKINFFA